jgi:hypothetical protein
MKKFNDFLKCIFNKYPKEMPNFYMVQVCSKKKKRHILIFSFIVCVSGQLNLELIDLKGLPSIPTYPWWVFLFIVF